MCELSSHKTIVLRLLPVSFALILQGREFHSKILHPRLLLLLVSTALITRKVCVVEMAFIELLVCH